MNKQFLFGFLIILLWLSFIYLAFGWLLIFMHWWFIIVYVAILYLSSILQDFLNSDYFDGDLSQ